MADSDGLRLAVLAAIIKRWGPLPCVHVSVIRRCEPRAPAVPADPLPGMELPDLEAGQPTQEIRSYYRCEASVLCVSKLGVTLEPVFPYEGVAFSPPGRRTGPFPKVLREPPDLEHVMEAESLLKLLCFKLDRLPLRSVPLGKPFAERDAERVLALIQVDDSGVKILPQPVPGPLGWLGRYGVTPEYLSEGI